MPQFVEFREEKAFNFIVNNPDTMPLSLGTLLRETLLRLTVTPTLTAANNTLANLQCGGPWGVIRKLDLIVNGSDTLLSLTGADLTRLHYFQLGTFPECSAAYGDATTANPVFDGSLIIPWWMPRSAKPLDTALDSRRLASLDLRVTWGTFTNINSAATAFTTNPVLTVSNLRSSGGIAPNARFSEWRRFVLTVDATTSNTQQRINLPVGLVYRGLLINAFDTSTSGDKLVSTVLNRIRVKSGPTVFCDIRAESMRQWMKLRYAIDTMAIVQSSAATPAPAINPVFLAAAQLSATTGAIGAAVGPNNVPGAWYYVDFVTDGRLSEGIDTATFSEFFVEVDVNGAANQQLRILPMALVPPRGIAR